MTKGLRQAVHVLYRSRGLDVNTYLEDNVHQDPEYEVGAEDHPERDNSISPPQPTFDAGTPLHSSTPSPQQPSTPITRRPITPRPITPLPITPQLITQPITPSSHHRYQSYEVPPTPGRDFTPLALRRNHRHFSALIDNVLLALVTVCNGGFLVV